MSSDDRIIEIACVELENFLPTGAQFHALINPGGREIDPDAERVHGISLAALQDKPTFEHPSVGPAFLNFIADAPLVAHNSPFDRRFVNYELELAGFPALSEDRWIDTYPMAQARFPRMYNSLDALSKRFDVSLREQDKQSALIDCHVLTQVYLQLADGGRNGRSTGETFRTSGLLGPDGTPLWKAGQIIALVVWMVARFDGRVAFHCLAPVPIRVVLARLLGRACWWYPQVVSLAQQPN